eukprot:18673-Heterococcus_DN1.PRE.1
MATSCTLSSALTVSATLLGFTFVYAVMPRFCRSSPTAANTVATAAAVTADAGTDAAAHTGCADFNKLDGLWEGRAGDLPSDAPQPANITIACVLPSSSNGVVAMSSSSGAARESTGDACVRIVGIEKEKDSSTTRALASHVSRPPQRSSSEISIRSEKQKQRQGVCAHNCSACCRCCRLLLPTVQNDQRRLEFPRSSSRDLKQRLPPLLLLLLLHYYCNTTAATAALRVLCTAERGGASHLAVHLSLRRSTSVLLPGLHLIGHLADGHAVPAWHKAGQPVIERAFNEGVLQVVLGAQLAAHAGDAVAAAAAGQAPVHAYVLADVAHDDAAAAGCLDAHLRRERERDKPRQAHSASEFFSQQLSMCGKGERRWSQAHKARAQQHNAEKNCTGDTATCMPHC